MVLMDHNSELLESPKLLYLMLRSNAYLIQIELLFLREEQIALLSGSMVKQLDNKINISGWTHPMLSVLIYNLRLLRVMSVARLPQRQNAHPVKLRDTILFHHMFAQTSTLGH